MSTRLPRRRLRAALLAVTALGGCVQQPPSGVVASDGAAPPARIEIGADQRLAVLRLVAEDTQGTPFGLEPEAWRRCIAFGVIPFGDGLDAGRAEPSPGQSPAALRPGWRTLEPRPAAAGSGDWLLPSAMAPGRYRAQIRDNCGPANARPLNLTLVVPAAAAPADLGTVRLVCRGADAEARRSCVLAQGAAGDPAQVGRAFPSFGTPVAAPALAFPPPLAALGLPPPVAPIIRVDAQDWISAIDWEAFRRGGRPVPLSEAIPPGGMHPIFVSDWSGAASGGGAIVGLGVIAAVVVVFLAVKGVQATVEAIDRQQTARVASTWGPCAASMAATLAPENIESHLRAVAPTAATPIPGADWSVSVPRLVMRRCGPAGHYGVEVASRWVASVPGQPTAAYDATFSRSVIGALEDRRLTYPTRPAWEAAVPGEAPCRPFAQYCAANGPALLLEDVAAAVTGARDAIAATR